MRQITDFCVRVSRGTLFVGGTFVLAMFSSIAWDRLDSPARLSLTLILLVVAGIVLTAMTTEHRRRSDLGGLSMALFGFIALGPVIWVLVVAFNGIDAKPSGLTGALAVFVAWHFTAHRKAA